MKDKKIVLIGFPDVSGCELEEIASILHRVLKHTPYQTILFDKSSLKGISKEDIRYDILPLFQKVLAK